MNPLEDRGLKPSSTLFPLPLISYQSSCRSARSRYRFRWKRSILIYTNHCISTLNRMYFSSSFPVTSSIYISSYLFLPFSAKCQPDIIPNYQPSCAQVRLLTRIFISCQSFILACRTVSNIPPTTVSDGNMNVKDILDLLQLERFISKDSLNSLNFPLCHTVHTTYDSTRALSSSVAHAIKAPSLLSTATTSLPHTIFGSYSTSANIVPLIAQRVSLPDSLHIIPLQSVLPDLISTSYDESSKTSLLRPVVEKCVLDMSHPLQPPRIAGSRNQYIKLIRRMKDIGMISFTTQPKAVNGVFTVEKDECSDRLIIDAQPANRCFIDSPHVQLPDPSCLIQLNIPKNSKLYTSKSDLSNFYHHLGLPQWMQPFFCLPHLTPDELLELSIDATSPALYYPMCLTLPMGFSHAVYLAQSVHEHILYSSDAVHRDNNILRMNTPMSFADPPVHGIYIDDFFQFSVSYYIATVIHEKVMSAYRKAGFIVKESKVVAPTMDPVKVIGMEVCGNSAIIQLPLHSQVQLLSMTLSVLNCTYISGYRLLQLIGSWTWCLLLRRPALAILQHTYRFVEISKKRRFMLWPSVKRELLMLLGVLPLLYCRMDATDFHRLIATDASSHGVGVVSTSLSTLDPSMIHTTWSLCSNPKTTSLQILSHHLANASLVSDFQVPDEVNSIMTNLQTSLGVIYDDISSYPWSVIISKAWIHNEHINLLELRAVLLALHWVLSYPSSIGSRVYCLVDSTVTFFSLWKGRSSKPKLLLLIRKINALLLASGIGLLCGWVPSECNPADGPSRLIH